MGFDLDPAQPIYLQLQEHIRRQIARGELNAGDRLPSVRDFASQAGVNPNTVQRAYAELERQGTVTTRRGEGTFVTEDVSHLRQLQDGLRLVQTASFVADMRALGLTAEQILHDVRTLLEGSNQGHEA
jgi:GntR family transcriptional regulator